MPDTATSADGTTIAFDRYGDGPPVVLVGGAFQHRAFDPETTRMAAALGEAGLCAVHYDRRGRGDSTDTAPYAVERELEDLTAVVDAVGGAAGAFGMSSGGLLVLEAARAGVPLTRLAVYEAPTQVASADPGDPQLIGTIETACADGRPGDAVAAFIGPMLPDGALAGMRQAPVWPVFESVAPTLAYDCRIVDRSVGADGLFDPQRYARIDAPLLVLNGSIGFGWMAEGADQLGAVVPGARRETLAGQAHEVDVDVLGPVLRDWFSA